MKWNKLVYFAKENKANLDKSYTGLLTDINSFNYGKIYFYKSRKVEFIMNNNIFKDRCREYKNIIFDDKIIINNFDYNKMYALIKYGLENDINNA